MPTRDIGLEQPVPRFSPVYRFTIVFTAQPRRLPQKPDPMLDPKQGFQTQTGVPNWVPNWVFSAPAVFGQRGAKLG